MRRILFYSLILCLTHVCLAQNTRSATTPKPPKPQYQAFKKEKKSFFAFLKKKEKGVSQKTNQEEVAEFRSRIKKVYRKKAKEEKRASKPQYADHSYFGHKRPPKKRPPGKQKFCKTCKMKH
ncbi:hypothetical protein [Ekhidna sp.]|uniref:hypothetical protein n=1 Tax=Ekhidna sp. TaxID=2608089 RepID=UPI003BACFEA1